MRDEMTANQFIAEKASNEKLPKELKAPGIRASVGWIILFMVAQLAGVTIAIFGDNILSGTFGVPGDVSSMDPVVIMFGILLGAVPIIALRAKYLCSMLSYTKDNKMLVTAGLSILVILGGGWIFQNYLIPGQEMQPEVRLFLVAMQSGTVGIIMTYLTAAVAAPVLEEILFRGQLQGAIHNKLSAKAVNNAPIYAILITSALFALVHLQPLAMPLLFLTGIVMGWIRYKTGSLVIPIVIHVMINTISVTMMLLTGEI